MLVELRFSECTAYVRVKQRMSGGEIFSFSEILELP